MDRQEAEQALGPRGDLKVTADNRGLVRKWLVACGVPSSYVGTLTLGELQTAYNDSSDLALKEVRTVGAADAAIERGKEAIKKAATKESTKAPAGSGSGEAEPRAAPSAAPSEPEPAWKRAKVGDRVHVQAHVHGCHIPAGTFEVFRVDDRSNAVGRLECKIGETPDAGTLWVRNSAVTGIEGEGSGEGSGEGEASGKPGAKPAKPVPAPLPPAPPMPKEPDAVTKQLIDLIRAVLHHEAPGIVDPRIEAAFGEIQRIIEANGGAGAARVIEIKIGDAAPRALPDALYHRQFPELLKVIAQNVPVFIVGGAGSGKTTAAEQAAIALERRFFIQGAVGGAHELLGFVDAQGRYQTTPFRECFEHGGLMCLDEIDAGDPAGILVMNSALANGHMPFPDQTSPVKKHESFQMIACANTYGLGSDRLYVGRNQLDAATLDRFYFLPWDCDETLERNAAGGARHPKSKASPSPSASLSMGADDWIDHVQKIRAAATLEKARIVISPRASIYGTRLLAAGLGRAECERGLIWKGIDADMRRRIETRIPAADR